jgi:DMSO/TMAO reductase YedYZ heme-binding membrane subunit
VTTTRIRSQGHVDVRSSAAREAAREGAARKPVILVSAAVIAIVLIFAAVTTSAGHVVVAATDHFLLKYAGVFALLALSASVVMGLVANHRIFMSPGHRLLAQAVHRAVSFGALGFLIIHIVLEIMAKRLEESPTLHVHLLDAFIPFLSQYRTFYMALGTISSDLIVLLVATSIVRRRFTASGNAWKWRAIHYTSYVALLLGIVHGLLAGRKAIGTYVYWSYGGVIALVALAVLMRYLAASQRTKDIVESAAATPQGGGTGPTRSMPARAAALGLMGQVSGAMPFGSATRAMPALQAADLGPAVSLPSQYGPAGERPRARQAIAAPPGPAGAGRLPRYEPGYDGPPRYEGAPSPRQPEYDAPAGRQQPEYPDYGAPAAQWNAGPSGRPMPSLPPSGRSVPSRQAGYGTGPQPGYRTGPRPGYGTGPQPTVNRTGPQPGYETGPQPAYRPESGYEPDPGSGRNAGYGLDPGYGAAPRPPRDGYGGLPPSAHGGGNDRTH